MGGKMQAMSFKFLFGTLKFRFTGVKLADGTAFGWSWCMFSEDSEQ